MNYSNKVASYITIALFFISISNTVINYLKNFVRKDDIIIVKKDITDLKIKCKEYEKKLKILKYNEKLIIFNDKNNVDYNDNYVNRNLLTEGIEEQFNLISDKIKEDDVFIE